MTVEKKMDEEAKALRKQAGEMAASIFRTVPGPDTADEILAQIRKERQRKESWERYVYGP